MKGGSSAMPETFAKRLTQLREQAGLSQYEVAKRSGVTRQTLSRLEMGDSVPSWPTVQALARALGVNCLAFVIEGEGSGLSTAPAAAPRRPRGRPPQPERGK
jgi:transcriptional regulator with XRE-family HTH domain